MLGRRQHDDMLGAEGERRGQRVVAELQHGKERQRQHVGRQALAQPGHGGDQGAAVLLVVEQHDGPRAAGASVGLEQCAQTRHQIAALGIGVADRSRRAHRAAVAAAAAERGIDGDMVAVGRDGAGRAIVEAVAAADLLAAGVRADAGVVADIERLLELADQVRHPEHGARHGGGVARVDVQIAVAALRIGKQRRAAGHVEDDVAGGARAVARHHELRARPWRRAASARSRRPRSRSGRDAPWPCGCGPCRSAPRRCRAAGPPPGR